MAKQWLIIGLAVAIGIAAYYQFHDVIVSPEVGVASFAATLTAILAIFRVSKNAGFQQQSKMLGFMFLAVGTLALFQAYSENQLLHFIFGGVWIAGSIGWFAPHWFKQEVSEVQ